MSYAYGILAAAGWIWTMLFFAFLFMKMPFRRQARGFEVVKKDEQ